MSLRGALSLPLPLRLKSALLALNNPCRAKSAYWCLVSRANKVPYVSVGFASTVLSCPLGFPATSNKDFDKHQCPDVTACRGMHRDSFLLWSNIDVALVYIALMAMNEVLTACAHVPRPFTFYIPLARNPEKSRRPSLTHSTTLHNRAAAHFQCSGLTSHLMTSSH